MLSCYQNCTDEIDKGVNREAGRQELISFLKEMTVNYASILALNSDIYQQCLPLHESYEGVELTAYRLMHLIESSGYHSGFMGEVNKQLKAMDEDTYKDIYKFIFT